MVTTPILSPEELTVLLSEIAGTETGRFEIHFVPDNPDQSDVMTAIRISSRRKTRNNDIPGEIILRNREKMILHYSALGHTEKQIACLLMVSHATVKRDKIHLFELFNVNNIRAAINVARLNGIIR